MHYFMHHTIVLLKVWHHTRDQGLFVHTATVAMQLFEIMYKIYNNIISKSGNTQFNVIIIKYLNTGTGLNDVPLTWQCFIASH